MAYVRKRDERVLGSHQPSRQSDVGADWWVSMRDRRVLTRFNDDSIDSEVTLGARAGQIVFQDQEGVKPSNVFLVDVEQVATPVISPNGGDITDADFVTITCATSGASIFYTIDGSTPTIASIPYTAPFALPTPTWTQTFDFTTANGGYAAVSSPPRGTWASGIGWESILTGGNTELRIDQTPASLASVVTQVTAIYDCTTQPDASTFGGSVITSSIPAGTGTGKVLSWTGSIVPTDVRFDLVDLGASGSITLKSLTVSGTGTNPFTGVLAASTTVKAFATKSGMTDSAVASAAFTVSTAFILAFGANPIRAKAASTYADLYTTASISGDAWDTPLYVPERNAAYMPRGNGSIGKFTVGGYSTISAQSGNTARGIGRVGNVLVAQWLVSFGSNPMARSTDYGDTWTAFTGPLATSGQAYGVGMCASSSRFIAIGTLLTGGAPVFSTSPDGITWTTGSLPDAGQTGQAYYVQAIGNIAICVGTRASGALRVHYSTDGGLTWANASTLDGAASTAPGTPFAAGGRFYFGLSTGGYYYSSDGSAWTAMPAPPTGSITAAMGGVGTEMWFDTSSGIRSYSPENGWSAIKSTESGYLYAGVYG